MKYNISLLLLLIICALEAEAKVKLPSIFSDNMMLQRDKVIQVWGKADDGEEVTVKLNGLTGSAVAKAGKWSITLLQQPAGGPYTMTVSSPSNTVIINNILIGEVWVTGGQSNMQFPLFRTDNGEQAIADGTDSEVRIFFQEFQGKENPQFDVKNGKWKEADSSSLTHVNGVGYYFIKEIQQKLRVPVGLVQTALYGSSAEWWTPLDALKAEPSLKGIVDTYNKEIGGLQQRTIEYEEKMKVHRQMVKEARMEGTELPKASEHPARFTTCEYNGMVAPLQPFAVRGVVWYQGEADAYSASNAFQYRTLFPVMINSWRQGWNEPDLPFLFVQLPNHDIWYDQDWAVLRESQYLTSKKVDHTGMVVAIDLGEENDVHPTLKKPVGERLALIARSKVYGEDISCYAPIYKKAVVNGSKVTINFEHTGKGLKTKDGKPPKEFTICGSDEKFLPARAEIKGDSVIVWADDMKQPVAVRYAWKNNPLVNLFNSEGLPVAPFRTDYYIVLGEK